MHLLIITKNKSDIASFTDTVLQQLLIYTKKSSSIFKDDLCEYLMTYYTIDIITCSCIQDFEFTVNMFPEITNLKSNWINKFVNIFFEFITSKF